uniref:Anaphase-promoting complex subunit 4 WD40 domain-containing protein n=1 Tax=Hyaloperonospora arabidopsidis (strain Emoy2) TaxID=559515 RepID=M4BCG2_HYAAE
MRVLVADETGLLKSIELEKSEQYILSSRKQPQARARGIQRLCWYANEQQAVNGQQNVVLARANGCVESYETSHGKILNVSKEPEWSWPMQDKEQDKTRCVGLEVIRKWGSVVQCSDTGDVVVRRMLQDTTDATVERKQFSVGGELNIMRLEPALQTVIGVGGKEHDLNLWSLETQQVLFKAKNVTHNKLDMRVPVWVKDLRFLSTPGSSNGYRVVVGSGYQCVRIYDSNTKRRPVQELEKFGEHPIQSLCVSPDETRIYVGDTAGNLDILDLRTLKHMGRCTGPIGSIRDISCHPTLPYIAAVGLDRMVHVFDVNTRKHRHVIYAKQRLNCLLFCADGLKDMPAADVEPARKKQKADEEDMDFDEDDEEAYEGLEISEEEDGDESSDNSEDDEGPEDDSD